MLIADRRFVRGVLWPLPLVLLALTACTTSVTGNGSEPLQSERALIGITKQALLACAGPPGLERTRGDEALFVYYREASQFEESFGGSKSSVALVHHGCRATITLQQDRVTAVQYESEPSSYRDEGHCDEIFQACGGP
jgi:hypothetical protein